MKWGSCHTCRLNMVLIVRWYVLCVVLGSCHTCRLNMVLIVRWYVLCVVLSHTILLLLSVLRSVEIWSGR